jgi:hypothetical protein
MLILLFYILLHLIIPCLHPSNHSSFTRTLDHVQKEPELEIQWEQAQIKASTYLSFDQSKPWCIPPIYLDSYGSINIYITVGLCITSIGIVWHCSCIKIYLPDFPWLPFYFSRCKPLANARHGYRKSVEVEWYWRPLIFCRSLYIYSWYNSYENV